LACTLPTGNEKKKTRKTQSISVLQYGRFLSPFSCGVCPLKSDGANLRERPAGPRLSLLAVHQEPRALLAAAVSLLYLTPRRVHITGASCPGLHL